jgi:hypothetical protein
MVALLGAWLLLRLEILSRGFPPGISVYPLGKMFPKLVPGKKLLELDALIKGNPSHCENLPSMDVPPGKGVINHGKFKNLDILLCPTSLGTTPKPLGILHPKDTPTPTDVRPMIGIVEVE